MQIKNSVLITLLSIVGIAITSFLIYEHYYQSEVCNFNSTFSCETVNRSIYSEVFGIPVAAFGLSYFVLILIISNLKNKKTFLYILVLSLIALVPSAILSYIELFVIHSICIFCESSKVLIISIAIISYFSMKRK